MSAKQPDPTIVVSKAEAGWKRYVRRPAIYVVLFVLILVVGGIFWWLRRDTQPEPEPEPQLPASLQQLEVNDRGTVLGSTMPEEWVKNHQQHQTAGGTVVAVDGTAKTVQVKTIDGSTVTLHYNDKSQFLNDRDASKLNPTAMKAGGTINATYNPADMLLEQAYYVAP